MGERLGKDFSIELTFDKKQFERAERYLKEYPDKMPKLIAESMNRAVTTMTVTVLRAISSRYNVTQKEIRPHAKPWKANASLLSASVHISDSTKAAWHLYDFKVTPRSIQRRPKKGLRVAVLRGNNKMLPHAFIAMMRSGHIGVFQRDEGAKRSPIHELISPTAAIMASQTVVAEEVEKKGYEMFDKRLNHAFDLLDKMRQG